MRIGHKTKLKVALVGCGQIADAHLQEMRKIECAQVVAVCDRHLDLASQAAARFNVPAVYDELGRMLDEAQPDVLHVTTPPQMHCALAVQALEAGVHVYVEKPFTVDAAEAVEVIDAAESRGLLVSVGHDQLFDPTWLRLRKAIEKGQLGEIVHVDSIMGYDLSGPFGRRFLTEPSHWIHRLPGGLFQNTISHPLYRITDFLTDDKPEIMAHWWSATPNGAPTELRATVIGRTVTGNLLFTTQARPRPRVAMIYGTRACAEVDLDAQSVFFHRRGRLPGPFGKLEAPWRSLKQSASNLARNAWRFARSDLHFFAGMNRLFAEFYGAILAGGAPPIPHTEIVRVTRLMDRLFDGCQTSNQRCCVEAAHGHVFDAASPMFANSK